MANSRMSSWRSFPFLFACLSAAALAKDLAVERLSIHQIEDGPAIDASFDFLPSETAYVLLLVKGFESKPKDDEFRSVALSYRITVTDPAGIPAVPAIDGKVASDLREQDQDWQPRIRQRFQLPDFAIRGKYKVMVAVKDEVSGAETRAEALLNVRNRDVPGSNELTIRNFGFYRSEDARRPLTEAVFHANEAVFVRFDVVGYKLGGKNALDVGYGLEVRDGEGKLVINQPAAAREKSAGFYPRRWLPVAFRLDLPPGAPKATYTLVLRLTDAVGVQDLETSHSFVLE